MECALVPMIGHTKEAGGHVWISPKTVFQLTYWRVHVALAVARANASSHPIHAKAEPRLRL